MSPRELAVKSGMSIQWIYTLIWIGRIKADKVDGRWVVSEEEAERFLERRTK